MKNHFSPYEGDQPFIFVSYSHRDSDRVLPIIKNLHDKHYRIWYDQGIEAGANWPEVIASHLSRASFVLFMVSNNFQSSQNCMREVNFAVDGEIPMASLFLESMELPPGLKMQLSPAVSVSVKGDDLGSPEALAKELLATGAFSDHFIGDGVEGYRSEVGKRPKKLNFGVVFGVVGILMSIAATLLLLGITQGWISGGIAKEIKAVPAGAGQMAGDDTGKTVGDDTGQTAGNVEITTWTNAVMRDLIISRINSQAVYVCGNSFVNNRSAITYSGGKYLIAGNETKRGDIADLEPFAKKTMLQELTLCWQNITGVSPLESLTKLQYLDLSGNQIVDISPLRGLDRLKTLKLSHTDVTDLTPARELKSLEKLYISIDMVQHAKSIVGGGFDVILTE